MVTVRIPAAEELGRRLRARRKASGRSQEGLGFDAGLHPTYIGRVERGEANLTLMSLLRIAHALGVDAGDLVRGLRP